MQIRSHYPLSLALAFFTTFPHAKTTSQSHRTPSCQITQQGMDSTSICYYKNITLSQAYQQFRNHLPKSEQDYLLKQMPTTTKKVTIDSATEIIYKPIKSGLSIHQSFAGGDTQIEFTQVQPNLIKVKKMMSAD